MARTATSLPDIANAADLLAFLRDDLDWPLPDDALADELTFDWSGDDLRLSDTAAQRLAGGTVRQLRPLIAGQPWGIFLVEFSDAQVYRTALRQILRGLVPNRRRNPSLQAWQHNNLLFICATSDYQRISFAHFRGEQAGRARLATFGWRRGSDYLRTLIEHNLPHLSWPDDGGADKNAWLAAWAKAFDKEAVTKQFFADFCAVFDCVANDIARHHAKWPKETVEREAQTLLNRLLFLYFIQRKGWLNRQRDCLLANFRQHADRKPNLSSYLIEFLQPIFIRLSTEKPPPLLADHDLPFLNGGLFSDEYGAEQRDDAVRRHHDLRVSNETFRHVFEELLERYNFTVREDTPLNQDVAIDPEMLGKIFEALVLQLEQSGTGGKSSRHDTGSHYTPRPYVHYLCRDALRAWLADQPEAQGVKLDTLLELDASDGLDDAARAALDSLLTPEQAETLRDRLGELRACDPGVGSGAFPVALLHELVNLARLCETRARGKDPVKTDPAWLFDTKTRFIERVIYGVDIQDRAIEICKLRLWLALVVDYPLDVDVECCSAKAFRDGLKRLPALPNLDFKIRRANSLLDFIRGEPVELKKLTGETSARMPLNRLVGAKRDFYNAHSLADKRRLRFDIYESLCELAETELTRARNEYGLMPGDDEAARAAELEQARKEMAGLRAQIRDARKARATDQDDALERLRARFDDPAKPTFVWQLDFAEVFHRPVAADVRRRTDEDDATGPADRLLTSAATQAGGFDLIVGNPPYVRIQTLNEADPKLAALYKERFHAASKGNYDLYVVFVERSLHLLQPRGQLAFILPHKFFNAQYGQPLRELLAKGKHLRHVVHFGDRQIFPGATNYVCLLFLAAAGASDCRWVRANDLPAWLATLRAPETKLLADKITAAEWNFAVGSGAPLFEKLQQMPVKLGDVAARISQGIRTSANDVYVLNVVAEQRRLITAYSEQLERQVVVERKAVLNFLQGREIKAYSITPSSKVIVMPYTLVGGRMTLVSAKDFQASFPKTWDYLSANKKYLENREDGRMRHEDWYGFIYPKNLEVMFAPKILVPDIADRAAFALDETGAFAFTSGYGITLKPEVELAPKYLLALLNSRLLDYYWKRISTSLRGGFFRYFTQFIEQLPICPINFGDAGERAEHEALVGLVERVLAAKRAEAAADTSGWEREIDERVYRLYDLTAEEIKLVEGAAK